MNKKEESSKLKIRDYTALDIAVSSEEGDKIASLIRSSLEQYKKVILDFSNVELLTSAFLNAAIGQLYQDFSSDELAARLVLSNVNPEDLPLFKKVTDRAKEYFKDTQSFSETTKAVLNDE